METECAMKQTDQSLVFQRPVSSRAVAIYAGFLVAWAVFLLIIGPSMLFNLLVILQTAVFLGRAVMVYRNKQPSYKGLMLLVVFILAGDTVLLWALQPVSLS